MSESVVRSLVDPLPWVGVGVTIGVAVCALFFWLRLLRADAKRVNWMTARTSENGLVHYEVNGESVGTGLDLRRAIDDAMRREKAVGQ